MRLQLRGLRRRASFIKNEERLNLCVPGGKETARMLKTALSRSWMRLHQRRQSRAETRPAARAAAAASGRSRDNARPAGRHSLSRARGSTSQAPRRRPGTSRSISPPAGSIIRSATRSASFPPTILHWSKPCIDAFRAPPDFPIADRTLRDVLTDGVSLSPAPDMLFQLISYLTGGDRRQKAKALASGGDPDGDAATLDVLAALQKFPGIRPDPEAFIESLDPLQPRALFDRVVRPKQSRPRVAHRRCRAL